LRQREDELESLGLRVAVVTFEVGSVAKDYARDTNLRWPLLADGARELYTAYGMAHGTRWQVFGPPAWWIYAKLLLKGYRLIRLDGDFLQLGGDILVDPEGVVRIHHVGSGPADRPSVDSILKAVRGTRRES
jgi:alkyl hydroperoxide reductase subunit AhpC